MTYLQRIDYRPSIENLNKDEESHLHQHFSACGAELVIDGQPVPWEQIEEVEVVLAPRAAGPAGWFVRKFFLQGEDRYHVGIYYGSMEAILPNVTRSTARHVVETIAYYAPNRVQYKGPEDLVRLAEI